VNAIDDLVSYIGEALEDSGGATEMPDEIRANILPMVARLRAETFREAARLLESTGRDDDAVNLLDNVADGALSYVPDPAVGER
jgi:hypothetical protein